MFPSFIKSKITGFKIVFKVSTKKASLLLALFIFIKVFLKKRETHIPLLLFQKCFNIIFPFLRFIFAKIFMATVFIDDQLFGR